MGRYISPYGYRVPTPRLQEFAQDATLFRQAHCCGPTCSPSRAGLLTGVTAHEAGMLGLAHRGFRLSHPEQHLGAYLKSQGYLTALVSHLDVYPTVCDLLDLPAPAHLRGHSLRPLLEGRTEEIREDLSSEVNFHASAEPMRSVRTQRFSYIRLFEEELSRPLANIDPGGSKQALLATGWGQSLRDPVQLYDLMLDPQESANVANDPR